MKSYDETINTVLDRISEYKTAQKRKKKIITRTVLPICSVTLAAAIGIGVWQSGIFKSKSSVTLKDSTVIGEKDYIEPDELDNDIKTDASTTDQNKGQDDIYDRATYSTSSSASVNGTVGNDIADIIGAVIVDEFLYQQFSVDEELFTADKYLGDARDFDGTYKSHINESPVALYTTKESDNVLIAKLSNGGTVVLGKCGDIIVNGILYGTTAGDPTQYVADKQLGTADDFEIIDVPYRKKRINPQDEIWSVKDNDDILLIKTSDGNITVFAVYYASGEAHLSTSCIEKPQ